MNDEASQRFAVELERLKRNYRARMRDSHGELEGLGDACRRGEAAACARVHAIAHGIAGTAGSYGFMEISQVATAVDVLCKDGAAGAEIGQALQQLIAALAAELV